MNFFNKVHQPAGPLISLMGLFTRTVESLAASARISAQETVCGQAFSSSDLISSMTWNPLAEFRLELDPFSLIMLPLLSNNSDASQPCKSRQTFCEINLDGYWTSFWRHQLFKKKVEVFFFFFFFTDYHYLILVNKF